MRWRPLRDIVSIQDEMNQLFDDFFGRSPKRWSAFGPEEGVWTPNVDVSETKDFKGILGFPVSFDKKGDLARGATYFFKVEGKDFKQVAVVTGK